MHTDRRTILKAAALTTFANILATDSVFASPDANPGDPSAVAHALVEIMETRAVHTHPQFGDYYTGYPDGLFTWETYLDNIVLLHAGETELGKGALKIYLSTQHPNGFIPRHWPGLVPPTGLGAVWSIYENEEHAQPFLFQAALFLARANHGNISWLND